MQPKLGLNILRDVNDFLLPPSLSTIPFFRHGGLLGTQEEMLESLSQTSLKE